MNSLYTFSGRLCGCIAEVMLLPPMDNCIIDRCVQCAIWDITVSHTALTAKFTWWAIHNCWQPLNNRTFDPKVFVNCLQDKQLTKTFGSNVLLLSIHQQRHTDQVKVCNQYQCVYSTILHCQVASRVLLQVNPKLTMHACIVWAGEISEIPIILYNGLLSLFNKHVLITCNAWQGTNLVQSVYK